VSAFFVAVVALDQLCKSPRMRMPWWRRGWQQGLGLGLALMLSACGGSGAEGLLADYAERVGRITGQPSPTLPPSPEQAYPRHRERAVEAPEVRGRLWDLGDFRRCDLSQLIAERNSIMGRYWPASQRLDYELRFAHRLGRCQRWLAVNAEDEESLAWRADVDSVLAAKAGTLAAVWWAVTYDSPEFERHFSLSAPLLASGEAPPLSALNQLTTLGRQLPDPPDGVDRAALESALQRLRERYGGRWQRSALALTATLSATAEQLRAADRARLCPQGRPTPEARIVETVFYRIYAERLQPYLAQVHQDGDAWLSVHEALLATVNPPAAFAPFRQRVLSREAGSVWSELAAARDRHTQAWQALLGDCGLMPSRPSAG
jgi:hypothetical protein